MFIATACYSEKGSERGAGGRPCGHQQLRAWYWRERMMKMGADANPQVARRDMAAPESARKSR